MKKTKYLIFIIICLVITSVILFNTNLFFENNKIVNSFVFIEAIDGDLVSNGMGIVYKVEDNLNYIITNYHVIKNNKDLYVYNIDNKKEIARVLDYDSYSDIAVLLIEDNLELKKADIEFNEAKKNDKVYYYNIAKKNIESTTVINLENEINVSTNYGNSFYNAVSIKGDINEGNSGGPIYNKEKDIIGIISLKEESNNISFYLPIEYVMKIVKKLENHTLIRPNIGGVFANTTNIDLLNKYEISVDNNIIGVVVVDIFEDYPLSIAGLVKGDIIVKINDIPITDVNIFQNIIYSYNIGDTIMIEYYSNNILNKTQVILNR